MMIYWVYDKANFSRVPTRCEVQQVIIMLSMIVLILLLIINNKLTQDLFAPPSNSNISKRENDKNTK